jgi:RimJ/RimL family protein N-acetyltransferase
VHDHGEHLETERLRLRPFRPDDIDALARWNADPRVMRYLAHWDRHGFGLWIAEDRATGEPVGRVGLSHHRTWPNDPEVGWALDGFTC